MEGFAMKKLVGFLLFFCLVFPAAVFAGGYASPSTDQLLKKIEELSRELAQVKKELNEVKSKGTNAALQRELEALKAQQEDTADNVDDLSDQMEDLMTNGVGRFQVFGDYRFRLDSTRGHSRAYYHPMDLMAWKLGGMQGPPPKRRADDFRNSTIYTNRLRLGVKVKATENVTFKGRLTMYKIWGMESAAKTAYPFGMNGFMWDPNISRRPNDNTLRVEMAYVNWTNIMDLPIWISVGRRPTVDGPPAQLRYNYDSRYATPVALGVDWTFDGATLGYMYTNPWPGKIRICYGRGYEAGFNSNDNPTGVLDDTDLYGFSWDIINDTENHRFANLQFFRAADIPDMMEGISISGNTIGFTPALSDLIAGNPPSAPFNRVDATADLGDIYHASFVYMDQFRGVDWFISAGLSRTDDRGRNAYGYGLLTDPGEPKNNHWGWAVYAGMRIPVEMLRSKIGFEYNFGSRYWINFTPAADDLYSSKLATRGHVGEIYWIWDVPAGDAISKYAKVFMRVGYQYYWFNYTGSGSWMGKPWDPSDVGDDPNKAQFFPPVDKMDNIYATFEVYF